MRWEESSVAVPGATLWTATAGAGVPLVLAHGGPGLSNTLFPVGEMVAGLARVHLYDQRGCGHSTAGGPYDVATALADLEAARSTPRAPARTARGCCRVRPRQDRGGLASGSAA